MIKEASLEVTQGGPMIFRTTESTVALSKGLHELKRYTVTTYRNVTLQGEMQHNLLLESAAVDLLRETNINVEGIIYFQHRTPFNIKTLPIDVVYQLQKLLASKQRSRVL